MPGTPDSFQASGEFVTAVALNGSQTDGGAASLGRLFRRIANRTCRLGRAYSTHILDKDDTIHGDTNMVMRGIQSIGLGVVPPKTLVFWKEAIGPYPKLAWTAPTSRIKGMYGEPAFVNHNRRL